MAVAFAAKGTLSNGSSSTSHSPSMPTHSSGQLLVCNVAYNTAGTVSASSGWTQITDLKYDSTQNGATVFWKIATSSSETITLSSTSSCFWYVTVDAWSGAGGIEASYSTYSGWPNYAAVFTLPSITTTVDNVVRVEVMNMIAGGDGAGPQTYSSNIIEWISAFAVVYGNVATAGASNAGNWKANGATNNGLAGIAYGIMPPVAATARPKRSVQWF